MKKLLTILLTISTILVLSGCDRDEENKPTPTPVQQVPEGYTFMLIGNTEVTIEVGEEYTDKGFIARYDNDESGVHIYLNEHVDMTSTVDATKTGTYVVTYTLTLEDEYVIERIVTVRGVDELNANIYCGDVMNTESNDSGYDKCSVTWSTYLDTYVTLNLYVSNDDYDQLNEIFEHVELILASYHEYSDKYYEYNNVTNVWSINQDPSSTHTISEELFDLIDFTLTNQESVIDYYNMAMAPVLEIWHDTREICSFGTTNCELPSMNDLNERNLYTDPSKIILDRENLTIKMEDNMALDLGGVSKGYISGVIVDYLNTFDVYGYLLNNGQSNISIGGMNPRTEDGSFTLAITDPTDVQDIAQKYGYAWVKLYDGDQLVTSGDYQKYFELDGVIYHHIISPVTLYPLNYMRSVSIIMDDPALADLYSTAIFNMTLSEGLTFVDGITDLDAMWFIDSNDIRFSDLFEEDHLIELR